MPAEPMSAETQATHQRRTDFRAFAAKCKSDPMAPQRVSSLFNAAYAHSPAQGSAATPALPCCAFALP
tara:strand:- start:104 stop:307 length:204 start_codon:yes stop_codon:yes gene_type:complete